MRNIRSRTLILSLVLASALMFFGRAPALAQQQSQSGAAGVVGTIPSAPPKTPATIAVPANGASFTTLPITVSGICTKGLLVEIFDNGVFVGSANCANGSYSLQINLFNGQNDLIARVYDALNQAGPDSNKVTVSFNTNVPGQESRPTLTTAYAKRGADPGTTLTWPLTLSGGKGPYAISIDWGDQSPMDLVSRSSPGNFNIEHVYAQSGIFNVTVKAVDANGAAAFLQLVGVSNGPIQQSNSGSGAPTIKVQKQVVWWPLVVLFVLTFVAFWLGKKHQLETIRGRLRRGERPI